MTFLVVMALLIVFVALPLAVAQALAWRIEDKPLSDEWKVPRCP